MVNKKPLDETLTDLIDKHFPEGKSKERGNALVMMALALKAFDDDDGVTSRMYQLRTVHEVQGQDGNWNLDLYQLGLFNGLELALAIMENREPEYRDPSRKKGGESSPAAPALDSSDVKPSSTP